MHWARLAVPALLLVAVPARASADDGHFLDGARRVDVERIAPASGRQRTAVKLHYAARAAPVDAWIDRTVIVRLEPGAEANLADLGLAPVRPLMASIGLWLAEDTAGGDGVDASARVRLAGADATARGVRGIMPNLYVRHRVKGVPFTPNDPDYPGQWFFDNLHMPDAWGITQGSASTSIVVVDTGCDLAHPDLAAKMDPGRDVVDQDDDPTFDPSYEGTAHGTECAGLVAAVTDNGVGVSGACPACRLRCVRLLANDPIPISADVDAYAFALDVDAAVVSNSWGFVDAMPVPTMLADAINELFDHGRGGKGALVVFAMGNDDRTVGADELEAVRGVLGVGAINNLEAAAPFTNIGVAVDVVAPTGTLTTDITGAAGDDAGDYMSLFGGTSSSCPIVAGIAGLLVSVAPEKTSAELYDLLTSTARLPAVAAPDATGHDEVFGYGIVDPVAALTKLTTPSDGGGGGATTAGAGGAPGTGGAGGAGGSDTETDESGCSCEAAGASRSTAIAPVAALAYLAWAARRRRR